MIQGKHAQTQGKRRFLRHIMGMLSIPTAGVVSAGHIGSLSIRPQSYYLAAKPPYGLRRFRDRTYAPCAYIPKKPTDALALHMDQLARIDQPRLYCSKPVIVPTMFLFASSLGLKGN